MKKLAAVVAVALFKLLYNKIKSYPAGWLFLCLRAREGNIFCLLFAHYEEKLYFCIKSKILPYGNYSTYQRV